MSVSTMSDIRGASPFSWEWPVGLPTVPVLDEGLIELDLGRARDIRRHPDDGPHPRSRDRVIELIARPGQSIKSLFGTGERPW